MRYINLNWKVFIISFVAQFIISTLLYFRVKAPEVFNFLIIPQFSSQKIEQVESTPTLKDTQLHLHSTEQKGDPFEQVKIRLEGKKNTFELKKNTDFLHLIKEAHALQIYDTAVAYLVVDFDTGEILAEKRMSEKEEIASITKVMTAMVALDLSDPDELFDVSEKSAAVQPTKIGVVAGQRLSLNELLHALLLTSANDAAEVIKEGIDQKYGEGTFIKAMNYKAQVLGLKNSSFENPQGFDGVSHISSAEDVAVFTHYALKNYPLIAEIVQKDYQFLPANKNHKQFDLYNWNGLLGVYPGISGVKIGYTARAGYTTVVVSERQGKTLMAVLLGAPGVLERDLWTAQLLNIAFEKLGIESANINEAQLREKYSSWK